MHDRLSFFELVQRIGGHISVPLGIDLDDPLGREQWLWVAALSGGRGGESSAESVYRALSAQQLTAPTALAAASAARVADLLAEAGIPKADVAAILLIQIAAALGDRPDPLEALARESENLTELGGRLTQLAPGFGPTAVSRFLRPLRDRWTVASEMPLAREAAAAAIHLGWLDEDADLETAAGTLQLALRDQPEAPDFTDVEAALERLGRTACLRRSHASCALADLCPFAIRESGKAVASPQQGD